jgi:hypothetical protein
MPESGSQSRALRYAVKTARRAGLTRDLPYGPEDLQWVANSATLVYGTDDAVLVDTFTSVGQNADLVDWVRSFDRTSLTSTSRTGTATTSSGTSSCSRPFRLPEPWQLPGRWQPPTPRASRRSSSRSGGDSFRVRFRSRWRSRRCAAASSKPEELHAGMLELYPRRANRGSLWGGAKQAMSTLLLG